MRTLIMYVVVGTFLLQSYTPFISVFAEEESHQREIVLDMPLLSGEEETDTPSSGLGLCEASSTCQDDISDTVATMPVIASEGETIQTFSGLLHPADSQGQGEVIQSDSETIFIPTANIPYNCDKGDITITDGTSSYTIQACNLGSTIAGTGAGSYGSYFQWGNNYGFPNTGSVITSLNQVDASAHGPGQYYNSGTFMTVDLGISNAVSVFGDWSNNQNDNLRGGSGDTQATRKRKDIDRQGPCETGYHVPSVYEWGELLQTRYNVNSGAIGEPLDISLGLPQISTGVIGEMFVDDFLLPLAGARDFHFSAPVVDQRGFGFYWSSSPNSTNAHYLYLDPSRVNTFYAFFRVEGFSVRCFKNMVDTMPPVIQSITQTPTILTSGVVTIEITATDDVQLANAAYSFDDGSTRQVANSKVFTSNGMIMIKVRDTAGNMSSTGVMISNIATIQPSGVGNSGGGGGVILKKDVCPNGDYSPSYYDGTCGDTVVANGTEGKKAIQNDEQVFANDSGLSRPSDSQGYTEHNSADDSRLPRPSDSQGQGVYERAKESHLTSAETYKAFRPNDYITRVEMAKIITAYMQSSLQGPRSTTGDGIIQTSSGLPSRSVRQVATKPTGQGQNRESCLSFTDLNQVNTELKSYIIQTCELGLMGYYSDGETVKESFSPNEVITRAEVATILSRMLRGSVNRGSEERWYQNHLLALRKRGVIQEDIDPMTLETRMNVFVMLSRI